MTAEEALEAGRRLLSGQEWYTQDAFRALNQVIVFSSPRCFYHFCFSVLFSVLKLCSFCRAARMVSK